MVLAGAAALIAAGGCGKSAPSSGASGLARLRKLEQRMSRLTVRSERYLQSTHTHSELLIIPNHYGRELGEASLSPSESEVFERSTTGTPLRLTIGGDRYVYAARLAQCDGGRPWVHEADRQGPEAFPYHAPLGPNTHTSAEGPYAGLIDLLATARRGVTVVGPATVDGKATTEYAAVVDPAPLLASHPKPVDGLLSSEDRMIAELKLRSVPTTLHVFIASSGLPVRVVTSATVTHGYFDTVTTDILAVDVPVHIVRPPVGQTIDTGTALALFLHDSRRCGIRTIVG